MARKVKIRNDEDKTIYELKLDDDVQNEKIKPSKVLFRIFLVLVCLGISILVGYWLYTLGLK